MRWGLYTLFVFFEIYDIREYMTVQARKAISEKKSLLILTFAGAGVVSLVIAGAIFLNDGVQNNASVKNGIEVEILQSGSGAMAAAGNQLRVHYVGRLEDGTQFDSSYDRGQAFVFVLGAGLVIQGWDIGIEGMQVGEKRRLVIPSEFGYGSHGVPGTIPPDATLVFEVELLEIIEQ
jgi:hypothetical protein